MRILRAALAGLGWAALGLVALAGVTLSAAVLFARSDVGRPLVARTLIRFADDLVAGRLELGGVDVLSNGGIGLRNFRAYDPDGNLVLDVDQVQLFVDLTHLRNRSIGLNVELDGPAVLLAELPEGGLSLARAFAPAHPSPPRREGEAKPHRESEAGFTLRVTRLAIRGGAVWWTDADGATRLEASGLDVDGRGVVAPNRTLVDVALRGALEVPVSGPLVLELRGGRDGSAVRVNTLRARVGDTVVEGLGQGDLAARSGRAALTQVAIDRADARALLPAAGEGGDLALTAYAESDGRIATVATQVEPREPGGAGRAHVAAAVRVDGARSIGLDLDLDRLDPSHVLAALPGGEVTLRGHGAAAGTSLETLRGDLVLALAPSRVRGGTLGPGEADVAVGGGSWTVRHVAVAAPGLALEGTGSWRAGGPVGGRANVDGKDLAAAIRNVEALLGRKVAALDGRGRLDLRLSGTSAAPVVDASLDAPALGAGGVALGKVRAETHLAGPIRTLSGTLDASAERVRAGGSEVARAVSARATLAGGEAQVAASASVPSLGRDPVTMDARARREGPGGELLTISELTIGYPGTRYALVRPATLRLEGPRVDLLELEAGTQRIAVEGGLGPGVALDARARVSQLRLEGLPAGILPAHLGIAGRVSADVRATGTTRRPVVAGTVAVEDGSYRNLRGLRASGELRWDGAARRAAATLSATRAEGGTADVTLDLPLPLAGRPGERVAVRVRADALPMEDLLRAADVAAPAAGRLALDARLEGAESAPALRAEATLSQGAYADLSGVGITVTADAPGQKLDVAISAGLDGRPGVNARGELPLDLAELLLRPSAGLAALRTAPFTVDVTVPGFGLEELAGRFGIPEGLAGQLAGVARVEGTLAAPRGAATLDVAGGAYAGYTGIEAHLEARAAADRVSASGRVSMAGEEVVRVTSSLGSPIERLATRAGLRAAALAVDAEIPGGALARAAVPDVPVSGTLRGTISARGTLAAPRISAELTGSALVFSGTPLGDAHARLDAEDGKASAVADLAATPGGTLHAALEVAAPLSIDVPVSALRAAPAELSVKAEALQLGFLPAVVPSFIRAAGGRLDADVTAKGPLARLSPKGKVKIQDGRIAVSEFGDWTDIAVDATVTEDAVEVPTLTATRGHGKVVAKGSLRGMASGTGKLEGRIETDDLTISRSASDIATLTMQVQVDGTWKREALDVNLAVARGALVRLPKQTPRTLQPLENRPDIVVGPRRKERPGGAEVQPAVAARPFAFTFHVVAPGRLQVQGDNPFVRLELKADASYEIAGKEDYMSGTVEVVRGDIEPISGRRFEVRRGKVTFTGGPPKAALLDVEAVYTNPDAVVTVNVAGPISDPEIRLSSQPPLDDAQIALLIATGRLELKPGTGGVQSFGTSQTGWATAGALAATQLFRNVIQDRLPLDTVSLDASALRAGKYVTDRIYVGYTHRFDARPDQGQNTDEVLVQYQITQRWAFEVRYGNAQSGGGSLIWSKDY